MSMTMSMAELHHTFDSGANFANLFAKAKRSTMTFPVSTGFWHNDLSSMQRVCRACNMVRADALHRDECLTLAIVTPFFASAF